MELYLDQPPIRRGGSCRLLKIPNFTAGLFEDIDVSCIMMRYVLKYVQKKGGKEGKFTDSRITGSLAHRSMAVKPEGEGLQSMGGLIPKENIEEGDDTTKIQVKLVLIFKKIHTLSFYLAVLALVLHPARPGQSNRPPFLSRHRGSRVASVEDCALGQSGHQVLLLINLFYNLCGKNIDCGDTFCGAIVSRRQKRCNRLHGRGN